jgi:uncharacterized protein (TIGR03435 family)
MKRCAFLGLMALMCRGGSGWAQTATPAFDAASIKPTPADGPKIPFQFGPNRVSMRTTLGRLIGLAYQVSDFQLAGGPEWAWSAFYDVQAEAGAGADLEQIRLMIRTLLADRFQLRLHRETRAIAGYILSVDKGGPKLPPARTDVPPDSQIVQIAPGRGIVSRGGTIKGLALMLEIPLGRLVVDETKIEGNYDFRLLFDDSGLKSAATDSTPGSLFGALHEIGLKLESKKIPMEVLVIDSVERPSEN